MKYVYTAIFSLEPGTKDTYNVSFPDLPGCNTFGVGLNDAISMAEDALCLWLYSKETDKETIPAAAPPNKIKASGDDFTTAISTDTDTYRRYYENKAVKKTLTIPSWLNQRAEDANINFSQLLQQALKTELHIHDQR